MTAKSEKRTHQDGVECPSCGDISACTYRCEHCGRDLAGSTTTEGRMA